MSKEAKSANTATRTRVLNISIVQPDLSIFEVYISVGASARWCAYEERPSVATGSSASSSWRPSPYLAF
jgi:hypothetical protein